jgi:hypothetical protein
VKFKVKKIAEDINAVLIFDEISSGWRMNIGGAYELYGGQPDVVVYAKAMSNGFPMAAVVGKREIMSFYNISDDRIKVLPFPITDIEKEKFEDFKKPFDGEYIFYPSTYYPHKNHFRILQSLIILEKNTG